MEFHPVSGKLIVCDTRGLLEVDVERKTVVPLVTHDNNKNPIKYALHEPKFPDYFFMNHKFPDYFPQLSTINELFKN